MKEGFYSLQIAKIVKETADASTFYFQIPAELKDKFHYIAGQYLTFEVNINGEDVRRSYSLCTCAEIDAMPAVTVKRVENGKMSNYMNNELKEGDTIAVMPPNGKFCVTPSANALNNYVLFAGGSGITPMIGIIKSVLNFEPNSNITLVYANRDNNSVIFKNLLADLEKNSQGKLKIIYSYDSAPITWFGLKGFLNEDKVQNVLTSKLPASAADCVYYICGPSPMMDVVKNGIAKAGVPSEKVHTEYFASPTSAKASVETAGGSVFSGTANITLTVYGKTHNITCDENTPILTAAMKQGIDPPYSCTVGVCTTCRAKVTTGEVHMLEREGLSDSEIKQGYVLTCQSVPRSSEIVLKYE